MDESERGEAGGEEEGDEEEEGEEEWVANMPNSSENGIVNYEREQGRAGRVSSAQDRRGR